MTAFEEARAGQVPVLLALGPGWCPAGAAMLRGAYADPGVTDPVRALEADRQTGGVMD